MRVSVGRVTIFGGYCSSFCSCRSAGSESHAAHTQQQQPQQVNSLQFAPVYVVGRRPRTRTRLDNGRAAATSDAHHGFTTAHHCTSCHTPGRIRCRPDRSDGRHSTGRLMCVTSSYFFVCVYDTTGKNAINASVRVRFFFHLSIVTNNANTSCVTMPAARMHACTFGRARWCVGVLVFSGEYAIWNMTDRPKYLFHVVRACVLGVCDKENDAVRSGRASRLEPACPTEI